jgi:hypothetical protein
MANFAQVHPRLNTVLRVISVADRDCGGGDFPESEPIGQSFINNVLKQEGKWLQTSYNGTFRKRLGGIGGSYSPEHDAFLPPKPFNSWILNETTLDWEAPVPIPDKNKPYVWNEEVQNWDELPPPPEENTEELKELL